MNIKQIKQKHDLTDDKISVMFGYKNKLSYANSTAKKRIEQGLVRFYELTRVDGEKITVTHSSSQLKEKNKITFDEYLNKHYNWYNGFYYEHKQGGYFTTGQIADKYKKEIYDKPLIV